MGLSEHRKTSTHGNFKGAKGEVFTERGGSCIMTAEPNQRRIKT